ncbi:hypothetical protein GXN76_13005 [Kroppenstedtia pulmonis]|uniref:L-serine ammonia-lyase n=1 Tax=Kroppenstedtia pulmonis TaxID=1380685 RepID=A0A7D3XK77_9BACL|nr:serine dehydratase beta chain [Kroppenstedtia pulmonis]QKG85299.1 hypothetical protein GXN76_13005 [Kroppenstedtia pulmonis]
MNYQSCFDIIGPIMVGPSSSHTAGVVSIGKFVHDYMGGPPERSEIVFYDSFAETYQGHGTDKAIVGGLLGMKTDDIGIRHALEEASRRNVIINFCLEGSCPHYDHPNTVMTWNERNGEIFSIGGVSLGGGVSKIFLIDGLKVDLPLNEPVDMDELRNKARKKLSKDAAVAVKEG